MPTFKIKGNSECGCYFVLEVNGRVVFKSNTYMDKNTCRNTIEVLRMYSARATVEVTDE